MQKMSFDIDSYQNCFKCPQVRNVSLKNISNKPALYANQTYRIQILTIDYKNQGRLLEKLGEI